jgi:hypothetical protein
MMIIQPKITLSLGRPQVSRGSESELDEEINLAAAGNTVVGKCKVDEVV